ncbi:Dehydrogenase/reductase SDR family member 11 [Armadillidium nasatum]|uniref:Dehydrogenase/reductase SDR family member 11 n=1 Tax=Armadillidium nasatum TaxID=96803 RepID=A0A5N5SUY5_9CRUS|nr:Dehydrogenase/reductase SDR family member 11 [Armadillidium nasatum]
MFVDGTPEEWRQITNVNVIALCLCSKLTVNSLKERGLDDGHIINISSIAAHRVPPIGSFHFYTGTKFAVRALSEGLRQELQAANSGIKLSVVSPGLVKTEILDKITENPEFAKQVFELNTSLKSEDIAHSVLDMIVKPKGVLKVDFK